MQSIICLLSIILCNNGRTRFSTSTLYLAITRTYYSSIHIVASLRIQSQNKRSIQNCTVRTLLRDSENNRNRPDANDGGLVYSLKPFQHSRLHTTGRAIIVCSTVPGTILLVPLYICRCIMYTLHCY